MKVSRLQIFLYLLPMLLTILVINMTPIVYTLYLSFTNNTLFNDEYKFVGLANYQRLLVGTDSGEFLQVLGLTVLYVVVCVSLFLIVGMLTALALNNPRVKLQALWRGILLIPWATPYAITVLIWKFLFNYDFGPINQILRIFFGPQAGIPWLTEPFWAFVGVVIVNVWLSYPFFMIVILGALQSIPQELLEAASVDGATPWQSFWRVTLPLLRPALLPTTILSSITTFQMFGAVYLITQGGPVTSADKPGATSFVMIYVYNQILSGSAANVQYAKIAAFAIILFIILGALTFLARALGAKDKELYA
ncbi:arabinogalactan oligomer/maltooligosaccharide transport system permease protein [Thermosporothrix hazakensis]|jgi:arabinogalactan oligomer/maltooligosaccharide transport system permease protein|uniref:Arabinogalactan oligomer/maltooligosaccharide transport system permease protein n=2 Tax=Thermosporothrix TaxID=768650 RepID=A0A326UAY4_THEHA|nr:sugar ABC transporter permease [Thermosporothrix hazakensis]PZW32749.1 arabinogalactan oligomer/maltooligosaccharide transport system permease protein [Thermosporothrix hazakensis]BBH87665.1 hypothetical protein KTC_24160 [Thermosporothrix sp. COM3]GCE50107.1 hypothetical protein KTH_49760 [Thermosporothrix hazakensis]